MSTLTSSFAPHIEAMLQWRASLGHSPRDLTSALAGFDRFCSARHPGETVLTRELATAWCLDTATGTWGSYRTRAVRELGKYLRLRQRGRLHRAVGVDRPAGTGPAAHVHRPGAGRVLPGR